MKSPYFCLAVVFLTGGATPGSLQAAALIPLPRIPAKIYDVIQYGARGDGTTPATLEIQKAIDTAAGAGGGQVVIPAGKFVSGPLNLASNIDFHLAKNATLLMSSSFDDFPAANKRRKNFISAEKVHDVRISGEGTIDGQGEAWWTAYRAAKASGDEGPRRPQLIHIADCERLEISGVTTRNPPNTHYSIQGSTNVTISGVTISAPGDSPNTDGLNLNIVKNVSIANCRIATGDDNIVLLGSAKNESTEPLVQNVTIRNCQLGVGHGLSIGSYTSGGVQNVAVENVSFDGTTSGLRMKAWKDRGGLVQNVAFKNVTLKNVRYPIFLSSYYPREPASPREDLPYDEAPKMPVWKNISFENITITDSRNALIIWGLPDAPFTNLAFKNVKISADVGALIFHARNVTFSNVRVTVPSSSGPALRLFDADVKGLKGQPVGSGSVKFL